MAVRRGWEALDELRHGFSEEARGKGAGLEECGRMGTCPKGTYRRGFPIYDTCLEEIDMIRCKNARFHGREDDRKRARTILAWSLGSTNMFSKLKS